MNWAASKGKIKQSVVDDFNKASKGMKLPETAPKLPSRLTSNLKSGTK
jgi:hypothetical protein